MWSYEGVIIGFYYVVKIDYNEVFGAPSEIRYDIEWFQILWINLWNHIRFQLKWLLPIPVTFPDNIRDSILGYRLDDEPDKYSKMG
jgi:hypothetical protein